MVRLAVTGKATVRHKTDCRTLKELEPDWGCYCRSLRALLGSKNLESRYYVAAVFSKMIRKSGWGAYDCAQLGRGGSI